MKCSLESLFFIVYSPSEFVPLHSTVTLYSVLYRDLAGLAKTGGGKGAGPLKTIFLRP